jgi:pSer/pThr/pTyr-binding forkhead associated (FHA) protein
MPEIIVKLGDNVVQKCVFDKEILSIGRARDNDIVIENLSVSRNHARIRKEGNQFILTDLNSANGSFVNGVRITRVEVVDEDVVTIGKHKLLFLDKKPTDEEIIGEAFGAERTMLVDRSFNAFLAVTKGKQKDQTFKITKYETYIGRASDNDVRLHDWFVSKKHAVIIRQGSNYFIKDLGSWRGTMVNGKNIRDCELKEDDEIQLGTTVLEFRMEGEAEVPQITGRVPQELGYDDEAEEVGVMAAESPEAAAMPSTPAAGAPGSETMDGESPPEAAAEDEYAPLSEGELEALEAEEERELGVVEEFEPAAGGIPGKPGFSLEQGSEALGTEKEQEEEEGFAEAFQASEEEVPAPVPGLEAQEGEEGGEAEALGEAVESEKAAASTEAEIKELPEYEELPPRGEEERALEDLSPDQQAEVEMWLNGLKNKSRVIRREAARKLKHLTGRDYDWESEPE